MTIALITGANKGIGFETAKQLRAAGVTVYIGARDPERGRRAADEIGARFVQLDVTDDASVAQAFETLATELDHLDVLVHNAGMLTMELTGAAALRSFDTNAASIVRVTQSALPLLQRAETPHVVTVSSSLGSFGVVTDPARPENGLPVEIALYAASKSAATMLTMQYAKGYPDIRFNAIEPGTTATDMTDGIVPGRPVTETARFVASWVLRGAEAPTGTYQDEAGPLPW